MVATVRILITTDYLTPGEDIDLVLRDRGHHTIHSPAVGERPPGELARLLADADAALFASEPITATMLDNAPALKVIARTRVGYESIDQDAATAHGIYVCNTPGANAHAVAEMTMMLLLMCARRVGETLHSVQHGQWPTHDTGELRASTLGVIGFGPIGRAVVELAHAFGMRILASTNHPDPEYADRYEVTFTSLDNLLGTSDYVSLHARPHPGNARLINARALGIMKDTAYLVNTSRGSLIDETALVDAVQAGTIAGAALDVIDTEPLRIDSPLRGHPNIVVTSHLAGQTREARMNASHVAAQQVLQALDGIEPPHAVNAGRVTRFRGSPATANDSFTTLRAGSKSS